MAQPDSLKSILFAFFANLSIAVAKGVAAWFTGSAAMLAETIHSLADSGNQLLLILVLESYFPDCFSSIVTSRKSLTQ